MRICFWKPAFAIMLWMSLVLSANAVTINVNSLADTVGNATDEVTLRWAINHLNEIGNLFNVHYISIPDLKGEIVLESDLPPISVYMIISAPAASVAINGASAHRIFSVLGGKLDIRNLTLSNALAKGGKGGSGGRYCAGGGGGGGMGAALFINQGIAKCTKVTFMDNTAQGGKGGDNWASSGGSYYIGGGGGGGFAGDGGTFTGSGGNGGSGGILGGEGQGGRSATYSYAAKNGGFGGGGGGAGDMTGTYNGGQGGFGGGGGGYVSPGIGGQGGLWAGNGFEKNGGGGAGLGGAIFVRENAELFLTDCIFTGNAAHRGIGGNDSNESGKGKGKGGAIFAMDGATVKVKGNITFIDPDNSHPNTADDAANPDDAFDISLFGWNLDIPDFYGVFTIADEGETAFPPSAAPNWSLYR